MPLSPSIDPKLIDTIYNAMWKIGGEFSWLDAKRVCTAISDSGLSVVRTGEVPPWMVLADGGARSLAQPDEIHYVLRGDL